MQQLINLMFYHIIHLTLLAAPLLRCFASKFYITVFSICIISLRFNFLLFVSIYCCSFFSEIYFDYMCWKKTRELRKEIIVLPFLRGSFVSFIYFLKRVCFHSIQARDDVCYGCESHFGLDSSPAMLTQHSTTQVGTTTHSFNFSMALL